MPATRCAFATSNGFCPRTTAPRRVSSSWKPFVPNEMRPFLPYTPRRRRARVSMMGPLPDFGSSKFFNSEIVQKEVERLGKDQRELGELGARYKTFDKEGKIRYLDACMDVVDRWAIVLQRFRLSEEFQCQLYVRQLETQLEKAGMTIDSFVANSKETLTKMKEEAERE